MGEYTPDRWIIVKVNHSIYPHYRVFGSWGGSYLYGASWRMNSGIVRHEEDESVYRFYGATGSCYTCHKGSYGVTAYGAGVLQQLNETNGNAFRCFHEQPDLDAIVWGLAK